MADAKGEQQWVESHPFPYTPILIQLARRILTSQKAIRRRL